MGSCGDLEGVWHLAYPFDQYFRKFWHPRLQRFQRSSYNCGKIHVRIILGYPILPAPLLVLRVCFLFTSLEFYFLELSIAQVCDFLRPGRRPNVRLSKALTNFQTGEQEADSKYKVCPSSIIPSSKRSMPVYSFCSIQLSRARLTNRATRARLRVHHIWWRIQDFLTEGSELSGGPRYILSKTENTTDLVQCFLVGAPNSKLKINIKINR